MRFFLLDRIDDIDPHRSVRARKLTSTAEHYWRDGGSGPQMPPTLVLEALCQAGTWLILESTGFERRAALLSVADVASARRSGPVTCSTSTARSSLSEQTPPCSAAWSPSTGSRRSAPTASCACCCRRTTWRTPRRSAGCTVRCAGRHRWDVRREARRHHRHRRGDPARSGRPVDLGVDGRRSQRDRPARHVRRLHLSGPHRRPGPWLPARDHHADDGRPALPVAGGPVRCGRRRRSRPRRRTRLGRTRPVLPRGRDRSHRRTATAAGDDRHVLAVGEYPATHPVPAGARRRVAAQPERRDLRDRQGRRLSRPGHQREHRLRRRRARHRRGLPAHPAGGLHRCPRRRVRLAHHLAGRTRLLPPRRPHRRLQR